MQVTEIKLSAEMFRQVNVDSVINSFEKILIVITVHNSINLLK